MVKWLMWSKIQLFSLDVVSVDSGVFILSVFGKLYVYEFIILNCEKEIMNKLWNIFRYC